MGLYWDIMGLHEDLTGFIRGYYGDHGGYYGVIQGYYEKLCCSIRILRGIMGYMWITVMVWEVMVIMSVAV